jgi:molybdate transport system ATP-binding protein
MALAGLLTPRQGRIDVRGRTFFDSKAKVNVPARKRNVGMLFQDYALFPHLSVYDNIAFGLKPAFGPLKQDHLARVDELLELCDLSGQARQRPAPRSPAVSASARPWPEPWLQARTCSSWTNPFTALDQPLREKMRAELSAILERFDMPMVMVSHDLDDVDHFAQTLVAFGHGRVLSVIDYESRRQTESPHEILDPLFLAAETQGTTASLAGLEKK